MLRASTATATVVVATAAVATEQLFLAHGKELQGEADWSWGIEYRTVAVFGSRLLDKLFSSTGFFVCPAARGTNLSQTKK